MDCPFCLLYSLIWIFSTFLLRMCSCLPFPIISEFFPKDFIYVFLSQSLPKYVIISTFIYEFSILLKTFEWKDHISFILYMLGDYLIQSYSSMHAYLINKGGCYVSMGNIFLLIVPRKFLLFSFIIEYLLHIPIVIYL